MTKRQRPKTNKNEKTYDGKASSAKRDEAQLIRQRINEDEKDTGRITPWQKAKAARRNRRRAAGKTYENWYRTNSARASKANVSNTSISRNGGEKQSNQRNDRLASEKLSPAAHLIKPGTGVAYGNVKENGDIEYMGGTLVAGVDF